LYKAYRFLAYGFSGWGLQEIKQLSVRERNYWIQALQHQIAQQRRR